MSTTVRTTYDQFDRNTKGKDLRLRAEIARVLIALSHRCPRFDVLDPKALLLTVRIYNRDEEARRWRFPDASCSRLAFPE